jgi:hypothetical protein
MEDNLFKKRIIEIIGFGIEPERAECKADELIRLFGDFQVWKDNPVKCPFIVSYNGIDKERPAVEYERLNKHHTIDQVFDYYAKTNLK